ncbi:MAG TPA: hypothetical protein ENK86_04700 [Campylobacterales bacterium]|nr:hypothetical protein [Campylobacterales bacterium]
MFKKLLYFIPMNLLVMTGCSMHQITGEGIPITGTITYDRVPVDVSYGGIAKLDYAQVKRLPSKYVVVKAIDREGKALAETVTDKRGHYTLYVPGDQEVKIRVYARMYKQGSWDVSVVDNTNMKAMYVMEGSYHTSGSDQNVRNLHATSGWTGMDYQTTRVAAPFAILDSINHAMDKVRDADPQANFPQLTVNWSPQNIASPGDLDMGQIVTSHYDGERQLWILGDANSDTDEYDDHIIIHEWGHYFEDQFSRSDSIGGPHSPGEALDIRLAFGEGWGNALSGIATDDPIYFDTSGAGQSYGWYMNLESGAQKNPGWYSEGSVQRILYDLYDKSNESHDHTSLGFKPIYKTMVNRQRNTKAFTSLFSFVTALKAENGGASSIDKTVAYENINTINDAYGSNRTNTANSSYSTPVYRTLYAGNTIDICNANNYGVYNKLGNRSYVKVDISSAGTYEFSAYPTSSYSSMQDPDILIYETTGNHENIGISEQEGSSYDKLTITLGTGEYLLDVYDAAFGNSCYTVSLKKQSDVLYGKADKNGTKVMVKPKQLGATRDMPERHYY